MRCTIWDCECIHYEWDGDDETDTPTCMCGHVEDEHGE